MSRKTRKPATKTHIQALAKTDKSANEIIRQLKREGRGVRRATALTWIREERGPYHVSAYGKDDGISKRYELHGTKKALYRFIIDAVKHPPKKRITRVSVKDNMGLSTRAKYIDYKEEWDDRPTIKS